MAVTPSPTTATGANVTPKTRERPKFSGVIIHHDFRGRFSIRYPSDWSFFEIRSDEPVVEDVMPEPAAAGGAGKERSAEKTRGRLQKPKRGQRARMAKPADRPVAAREGVGFAPDPRDPHTVFTIWVSPLGERVVAEDLEDLRAGVDEGLRSLEDCQIEAADETILGNLIRFERIYTFRERTSPDVPGDVRKRKQWLLYVDTWLMCLTWQGSSVEEYAYWFAMANQSFLTFEIQEALWFYTDRELAAELSDKSVGPSMQSVFGASNPSAMRSEPPGEKEIGRVRE
ncbi:MAG: hypothetical protein HY332_17525 [Chloroflexi bacterium]|nr:hypothetical protein [Chloroflexota bacterium]